MRALPRWVPRMFRYKVGEWLQMWGGGLARVSDSLVGSCVFAFTGSLSNADSRGGRLDGRRSLLSTPPREPSRPRSTWTRCRRPAVRALAPSRDKECRDPCITCAQGSRLTLTVRRPGAPDGVHNSWPQHHPLWGVKHFQPRRRRGGPPPHSARGVAGTHARMQSPLHQDTLVRR